MMNATQGGPKQGSVPTAEPAVKVVEKKGPEKRDGAYYRTKLQEVQGRLKKVSEEIAMREKKNEGAGSLLRQRRSLRSWEARFQKRLKVS